MSSIRDLCATATRIADGLETQAAQTAAMLASFATATSSIHELAAQLASSTQEAVRLRHAVEHLIQVHRQERTHVR